MRVSDNRGLFTIKLAQGKKNIYNLTTTLGFHFEIMTDGISVVVKFSS